MVVFTFCLHAGLQSDPSVCFPPLVLVWLAVKTVGPEVWWPDECPAGLHAETAETTIPKLLHS